MKSALRHLFLAVSLAASLAGAQTPPASSNPLERGDRGTLSARNAMQGTPLGSSENQLTRPNARFGPVTPVPEPSEWAMLLAGLAVVGWIVRRRSNRS